MATNPCKVHFHTLNTCFIFSSLGFLVLLNGGWEGRGVDVTGLFLHEVTSEACVALSTAYAVDVRHFCFFFFSSMIWVAREAWDTGGMGHGRHGWYEGHGWR
jgi:hypothetical protein